MTFEENKILFGHDPTERIVAVELEDSNAVKVYIREADGSTTIQRESFHPFLWTDTEVFTEETTSRKLAGDSTFGFLIECNSWPVFSKLRSSFKNGTIKHFALSDPVQQFLLQTGKTLFKGMQFTDLHRMQINIEIFSDSVQKPTAAYRSTQDDPNHLLSIALSDNKGWKKVLVVDPTNPELSEQAALEELTSHIQNRDPDIIEGHDLFKICLPHLVTRAKRSKVKLNWGRNGSVITSRPSRIQIAERTINYPKFQIHGRHLVDTFLLVQFYDITARELESYGLNEVAGHFRLPCKVNSEEKKSYLQDPAKFQAEALQAVHQIEMLASMLSGSYFVQAKIFPYNYQDVIIRGNATKIDALLLREYYRQQYSIPDLPVTHSFEGGYTDIFYTGIARDVWHCDITSLYPSVMLQFDCFPKQDRLGIFRGLLTDLRKFRLEAKTRMRESAHVATNESKPGLTESNNDKSRQQHNYFQALQSTFKILINSFYGYLGFSQAHFADFEAAARVTEIGRDLLKKMVEWLQNQGAQVIEIDTDGVYFVPPPNQPVADLQKGLGSVLPAGIDIEFDTQYQAMFSYKAKNYALLKNNGELVIKGGAFKSRGLEKFQRLFLEQMIRFLLKGEIEKIIHLYHEFESSIRLREWAIEYLMKTDTLQDSLSHYLKKIGASSRNRSSAYELAVKSGKDYQPGDRVSYYITGTKKNISAYENSKLVEEWNPSARDENIDYYVAKLNELMKKFSSFIETPKITDDSQMKLL